MECREARRANVDFLDRWMSMDGFGQRVVSLTVLKLSKKSVVWQITAGVSLKTSLKGETIIMNKFNCPKEKKNQTPMHNATK